MIRGRRARSRGLLGIAAPALVGALCLATVDAQALQQKHMNGVDYISGGVGKSEQDELNALAGNYNLKLVLAEKVDGAYLSDVDIRIEDAKGNTVLESVSDGPLFLAKLPPGTYRVHASSMGNELVKKVSVGERGHKVLNYYW